MSYTNKEYAEMAHRANLEGKRLVIVDDELFLEDILIEDIPLTNEEIEAKRKALYTSLVDPLVCEYNRKNIMGTAKKDLTDLKKEIEVLSKQIKAENPYNEIVEEESFNEESFNEESIVEETEEVNDGE